MKQLLVALLVALALTGCHTLPKEKEIVVVDKPIPYIPPPPVVPKYEYQVDKLTDADLADPGKVGQAYKYDMTLLRQLVVIYQSILDQYAASSQNFDDINRDIEEIFKKIAPEGAPKK